MDHEKEEGRMITMMLIGMAIKLKVKPEVLVNAVAGTKQDDKAVMEYLKEMSLLSLKAKHRKELEKEDELDKLIKEA